MITALIHFFTRLHDRLEARHLCRDCDCSLPSCVAYRASRRTR